MKETKYIISEEKLNRIVKEVVMEAIDEGLLGSIVGGVGRVVGGIQQGIDSLRDRWYNSKKTGADWMARKLGINRYDDEEEIATTSKFGPRNNPDIEMINRAKNMK